MLDDLKHIHQRDSQDALGIAEKQWQQLEHQFDTSKIQDLSSKISSVVYAGMGGSALAALISRSWPSHKLPFEICREYKPPKYIGPKTLFIAASYSGNTEEEVSALSVAEAAGAQIVVIAGGSKLAEMAHAKEHLYLEVPKVAQPRYAVLYMLKALVSILEAASLVSEANATRDMHQAAEFIKTSAAAWRPDVPMADNPAKKLAMELAGKSIVIYGGPLMAPAAYKWKINFNENAKNVAWWNYLPEFNHNEMIGWSSHPLQKPYAVIELRSNLEHPRVQKRFEVTERLLSGLRPSPHVVEVQGQTLLEQLLWAVVLGDFVSIYLALLNGVDPAPVDLVEKFKLELDK